MGLTASKFFSGLTAGMGVLLKNPKVAVAIAGIGLMGSAEKSSGCLRPDGSNQADYIAYAQTGPCNKYLLYLVAQYPGGTDYGDLTYKDKWNAIVTSHEVQFMQAENPTNYFVAIGTNWYTATTLCGVANIKRYPGSGNGIYSVPDVGIVTFSTPLNLGIPDVVIGPPPAVGTTVVQAGNGYDGTPSMDPTNYTLPGPMAQWNAGVTAGVPGNVSPDYFFTTSFAPNSVPLNGKLLNGDSSGPTFVASYITNGIIVTTNYILIAVHSSQVGNGGETGATVDLMLAATDTLNFISSNSFSPQSLQIQAQRPNGIVTWSGSGILQSAASLSGSFSDVSNATNSYTFSTAGPSQLFFRLRPN